MNLTFILKMMKPLLGDIEKKIAVAMSQQDKEYEAKNVAYLIRRVKKRNAKGEIIETCQMSFIDIDAYTGVEDDPMQEFALKALFIKDKSVTSATGPDGKTIEYPKGKNISMGIEGIFASATNEKEED